LNHKGLESFEAGSFELLMLVPEQIIDSFYRIEGDQWDFYEKGIPACHRPIPKPRQFQCLQVSAAF
jgi:hypothetical protein